MRIRLCVLALLISIGAIGQADYQRSIAEFDNGRIAELKAPSGWLNLAGLFWLAPGINSFGSSLDNKLQFHAADFPATLGEFEWSGDTIFWTTFKNAVVTADEKLVARTIALILGQPKAPVFAFKHYRWTVIQRSDRIGVRFRDLEHPSLRIVTQIPRYQVDTVWRIQARLIQTPGKFLRITNVLGQTIQQPSAGRIEFRVNGQDYSLDALDEGNGQLFILFGDDTNGLETYASGRFLYVQKPGASGEMLLDFNRAENPPCAFTSFATCPLPPPQNRLPIAIPAGEKAMVGLH